jgi:hypothetical protein
MSSADRRQWGLTIRRIAALWVFAFVIAMANGGLISAFTNFQGVFGSGVFPVNTGAGADLWGDTLGYEGLNRAGFALAGGGGTGNQRVQNAQSFIDFYEQTLAGNVPNPASIAPGMTYSNSEQARVQAAFTILNMLGEITDSPQGFSRAQAIARAELRFEDWRSLVNVYVAANKVTYDEAYTYRWNTLYWFSQNDIVAFQHIDLQTSNSVVFRSLDPSTPDDIVYTIKRDCANPVGDMTGLPLPPSGVFTVTPIVPQPAVAGGSESPTSVQFSPAITISSLTGATFSNINMTTIDIAYTLRRGAVTTTLANENRAGPYLAGTTHTFARTFSSAEVSAWGLQASDEVCARITIRPTGGTYTIFAATNNSSTGMANNCFTVQDLPYMSAFGADVIAGNGFGDSCAEPGGQIIASFDAANYRGSGTQFAAIATGQITRFSGGKMRGLAPRPPKGLNIANTGAAPASDEYGGGLQRTHCVFDYGSTWDTTLATGPSSNLNGWLNNSGSPHVGRFTLGATTLGGPPIARIPNGTRAVLYSQFPAGGDRILDRNIHYDNEAWTAIDEIPSFVLIVKGDIHIDRLVNRLDGIYVAVPRDDGTGGNIYTCSNGTDPYTEFQMQDNCTTPLTVNGALIANRIVLNRYAASSLRKGTQGEFPYAANNANCGRPVCAAEVINFSPELFLAPPLFDALPPSTRYESITSLPPIL